MPNHAETEGGGRLDPSNAALSQPNEVALVLVRQPTDCGGIIRGACRCMSSANHRLDVLEGYETRNWTSFRRSLENFYMLRDLIHGLRSLSIREPLYAELYMTLMSWCRRRHVHPQTGVRSRGRACCLPPLHCHSPSRRLPVCRRLPARRNYAARSSTLCPRHPVRRRPAAQHTAVPQPIIVAQPAATPPGAPQCAIVTAAQTFPSDSSMQSTAGDCPTAQPGVRLKTRALEQRSCQLARRRRQAKLASLLVKWSHFRIKGVFIAAEETQTDPR
jgi:hypothetical protein